MMRRVQGLFWILLLISIVIGVPVMIRVTRVVDPLIAPPESWPEPAAVGRALMHGEISHDAALAVTGLFVIVVWLRFIAGVCLAIVCAARGRPCRPRWGLGGVTHSCALGVVSGALLIVAPGTTFIRTNDIRSHSTASEQVERVRGSVVTACPTGSAGLPFDAVVGLPAAVLLVGGVLVRIDAQRRRALRCSSALVAPRESDVVMERRLRDRDHLGTLHRLDLCLRLALGRRDPSSTPHPQVVCAVVRSDGAVHVTLTSDMAPVSPFIRDAAGQWLLPASVDTPALAEIVRTRSSVQPTTDRPLIVHVGSVDDGEIFLDLGTIGCLAIEGDDASHRIAVTLAASLSVSPFAGSSAGSLTVIDVGCHLPGIVDGTGSNVSVAHADSVDDAAEIAARHPGVSVLVTAAATEDQSSSSPNASSSIAVVGSSTGEGGPVWRLAKREGTWVLEPLGCLVTPVMTTDDDLGDLRRLSSGALTAGDLDVSNGAGGAGVVGVRDLPPHDVVEARLRAAPSPVCSFEEPAWTFVVRVLGPVCVEGRDGSAVVFEKAKSEELVTWLALHRERQSRAGVRTAMWELDVQDATFANVVSEARRALARTAPSADDWLGRALGDRMPLSAGVVTDADLLEARLIHSRVESLVDAVETLRGGLCWVRGMPCSGARFRWPDADGTTSRLVVLVTTAAVEMANRCLTVDDLEGVFWATGRGLMALPGHEELVGLRMRGFARRGDLSGVRHEWDTYLRALTSDAWCDDPPSPKLVSLRSDLLSSRFDGRAHTPVGVV